MVPKPQQAKPVFSIVLSGRDTGNLVRALDGLYGVRLDRDVKKQYATATCCESG